MRNKKPEEPEKSAEEKALEERVDAMMDAKRSDEAPETATHVVTGSKPTIITPTIETTASQAKPSAPVLPRRLLSHLAVDETPTKPLLIDKLDQLTGGVTETEAKAETEMPPIVLPDELPTDLSSDLNDAAIDGAVDDIVAKESDIVLAVEDAQVARRSVLQPSGWEVHVRAVLVSKWTWLTVVALLAVIVGLYFEVLS